MASPLLLLLFLFCLCLCFVALPASGDIGTATSYEPPYLPTKCKGYDKEQFPESGYFLAASDGVWDNGAACGRRYRMRCTGGPCKDTSIVLQVVDFCHHSPCPSTFVVSKKGFDAISRNPDAKITVIFTQI